MILGIEKSVPFLVNIKNNIIDKDNNKCPKSGGQLIERTGKYGYFIGCSNYPKCKYIRKKI